MGKILSYIQNNKHTVILAAIFFAGVLLRTINFGDLLILKADQARDVLIMQDLKKGADFPLLGPQIGGTGFRLGPMVYYFQYLSGKIFGFTPEGIAYPDLTFGILTVPLLFLLFRKFFSAALSLWLTALASVSLLLVTFSRFAWNPNSLPFFTTLFAITFLSALEVKGKKRWQFMCAAAVCAGIIAQLHFAAIISLALGLVIFLFLFKLLKWKEILLIIAIACALNTPVFINEWKTSGGNFKEFSMAFNRKSTKNDNRAIYEKIFRAYQENARVMWLIAAGQQNTDNILTRGLSIKCDQKCKSALPYSILAMALFGYVITIGYSRWKNEKDQIRKKQIAFMGIWFLGFFIFSVPTAYQLETRFYLGITPPLFVFLGTAAEKMIAATKNIQIKKAILFFGAAVIFFNLYLTIKYLRELSVSRISTETSGRDLRFGTAPKVTLGQLRDIGKEAAKNFNRDIPVIITGESLHVRSVYYVLSAENDFSACYLRGEKNVSPQFNHLIIKYAPNKKTPKQFGTLSADFIKAVSSEKSALFPEDCLK